MDDVLNFLLRHADAVEWGVVCAGLGIGLGAALWWPGVPVARGVPRAQQARRWLTNIGLYLLIVATLAVGFQPIQTIAIGWGSALGWGGISATAWPEWTKIVVGFIVFDLLQYTLHAVSHRLPWLWRLHRVHHSDTGFDATTAIRHHPFEAALNGAISLLISAAVGMPLLSIVLYGVVQLAHTFFCHANIALPQWLDRVLRWVVVTPDMHRIHHSSHPGEGERNFGMVLSWWDPLFGTLTSQPALGQARMQNGLYDASVQARAHSLPDNLLLPFRLAPKRASVSSPRSAPAPASTHGKAKRRQKQSSRLDEPVPADARGPAGLMARGGSEPVER